MPRASHRWSNRLKPRSKVVPPSTRVSTHQLSEIQRVQSLEEKLRTAVDTHTLEALAQAVDAAEAGGLGSHPDCAEAKRVVASIKAVLADMDTAYKVEPVLWAQHVS